jgi:uncharacterized protein GlcG (DUF336 family)
VSELDLDAAKTIIETAFAKAGELGLKPLAIAVVDSGGHLKAFERQDGATFLRPKIAFGKAYGAIGLGAGSRALHARAEQQAYFINAVNALAEGNLVPVAGGVVIRDAQGNPVGAVGVTGDTSENDEACALAGIEAAGFQADTGA